MIRYRAGLLRGGTPLILGLALVAGTTATADDGFLGLGRLGRRHKVANPPVLVYQVGDRGTLGYGPPGLQGFGLGYHPGYGYGGDALGVGASGGYPFYSGPGYPHPAPALRRLGGTEPFPYYGGPGTPTPAHPNAFAPAGPLVPDRPVVTLVPEPGEPDAPSDFGFFTGTLPYPENYFAPSATSAASSGSGGGLNNPQPTPDPGGGSPGK